jgi:hypothetical protein
MLQKRKEKKKIMREREREEKNILAKNENILQNICTIEGHTYFLI